MKGILLKCLAPALVLWTATAGCGKQSPSSVRSEGMAPEAAAQTTPAQGQTRRNACALVDREDIEAIAGQPLTLLNDIQEEDLSVCELSDKDGNVLVYVTVHWKGGRELARIQQAAMSMAKQQLNDEDVDIEELTGSGKVRGLADKAYYSDIMPSWLLKGDVLIEVISPLFSGEKTKKIFLAVAKKALASLPS
ncbi:MAG: hypothetical protein A2Y69_07395 [Candidatus Aminicenantes bacterium RBG_13_59_9]|nr:MAG: hypothetical protein A2Y69_07395 [Candidatus Aminicenantes bacterium RBG_13_59_9]